MEKRENVEIKYEFVCFIPLYKSQNIMSELDATYNYSIYGYSKVVIVSLDICIPNSNSSLEISKRKYPNWIRHLIELDFYVPPKKR